jgi:hypothetical protein
MTWTDGDITDAGPVGGKLRIGQEFKTDGYDLVASARYAEGGGGPYGEAILLSNNSSCFMLAIRPYEGESAQLEGVFYYHQTQDEEQLAEVYRTALRAMTELACRR